MTIEIDQVLHFKITSGDELLGKVIENDDEYITLDAVVVVQRMFNGDSYLFTMKPWMLQQFEVKEPKSISIAYDHIMAISQPQSLVFEQYLSTVGYLSNSSEMDSDSEIDDEMDSDAVGNLINFKPKNMH